MDTSPNHNDGAVLSLDTGTIPMIGVLNKTISDAFACSGGGFRLLLPLLLIVCFKNWKIENVVNYVHN